MSREESTASQSGSTDSSSSQLSFFQDNLTDLSVFGSPTASFVRKGTVVRRANSVPLRKDRIESTSSTEDDEVAPIEKYRKDAQYRHSLAAISERRSARNSFSSESEKPVTLRSFTSMETSSDNTDYYSRSNVAEHRKEKSVFMSPSSSSYLSWIESVNSVNYESVISDTPAAQDVDNKVGEWNNFWLNYSNARLRHLSTELTISSDGDRTADETSEERKSQESNNRDATDKNSLECVMMTIEEISETMRCSQRITEILQNAMKRSEGDASSNESYYSQPLSAGKASMKEDMQVGIPSNRERSVSCVEQQTFQKQKQQQNKTAAQQSSSSTSCINAILTTSVTDILKKVISKRRDVMVLESEPRATTRSSFSEWSER